MLHQDFWLGGAVSGAIMLVVMLVFSNIAKEAYREQMIELGVGEYYLDDDNNKKFRTFKPEEPIKEVE